MITLNWGILLRKSFLFMLIFTLGFLLYFQNAEEISRWITQSEQEKVNDEKDNLSFGLSAIKKNQLNPDNSQKESIDLEKQALVADILKASQTNSYQENIIAGIKHSLAGKVIDPEKEKHFEKFAEAIAAYSFESELTNLLNKYSKEQLNDLLKNMNHPANQKAMAAQKEKIQELTEISARKEPYFANADKQVIIDEIVEASRAIEMGQAVGDATSKPIFMAIHKNQNPKANTQEMAAFAEKVMEQTKEVQRLAMNNVLNWSFEQVSNRDLEDYRRFVNQELDRRTMDRYLEDSKALYDRFGKYLGEQVVQLITDLKKNAEN